MHVIRIISRHLLASVICVALAACQTTTRNQGTIVTETVKEPLEIPYLPGKGLVAFRLGNSSAWQRASLAVTIRRFDPDTGLLVPLDSKRDDVIIATTNTKNHTDAYGDYESYWTISLQPGQYAVTRFDVGQPPLMFPSNRGFESMTSTAFSQGINTGVATGLALLAVQLLLGRRTTSAKPGHVSLIDDKRERIKETTPIFTVLPNEVTYIGAFEQEDTPTLVKDDPSDTSSSAKATMMYRFMVRYSHSERGMEINLNRRNGPDIPLRSVKLHKIPPEGLLIDQPAASKIHDADGETNSR